MKQAQSVLADAPPGQEEWWREFDAASRRPLPLRMRYAFIRTHKPVLDDAAYRSFDSMSEYRAWCDRSLPVWLGFHSAGEPLRYGFRVSPGTGSSRRLHS